MKNKIVIFIILAITVIGGAIVYFLPQKPTTITKITLATHRIPLAAPFIIAKEKGFFQKNGLDADLIYLTTGLETLNALVANKADFASAGATPYVHLSSQRDDIKIINEVTLANDFQIIARKDAGVRSLKDLQFKKIGFIKGTLTELIVVDALKKQGLSRKSYMMVEFNQPLALPNALLTKDIDAYSAWEPFILNGEKAVGSDKAVIFGSEKEFDPLSYLTMVRSSYLIDQNKKTIDRFHKSLLDAIDYMTNNSDESIAIVAQIAGMDANTLSKIWNKYDFRLSLSKNLLIDLNRQKKWFKKEDDKFDPNYKRLIDTASLKRVIPQQVEW